MSSPTIRNKIVISTFGSDGNVFPYILWAEGLKKRGYFVTLVTSSFYKSSIEKRSLEFCELRPAVEAFFLNHGAQATDEKHGSDFILKNLLLPAIDDSYHDLKAACLGANLLITQNLCFAGPLVAEKLGIPWVSSFVTPMSFCSAYDPPFWIRRTLFSWFKFLGPRYLKLIFRLAEKRTDCWFKPLYDLRKKLGLPMGKHPLFQALHSPHLMVGLFSECLIHRQPDWPTHLKTTGFLLPHAPPEASGPQTEQPRHPLGQACESFLARSGRSPLVFTLGSSASLAPQNFYVLALHALKHLEHEPALFICPEFCHELLMKEAEKLGLNKRIHLEAFVPFAALFPRAQVVVHAGGMGTAALTLRAGVPSLIIPHCHDQPDTARRLAQRDLATVIPKQKLTARSLGNALGHIIKNRHAYVAHMAPIQSCLTQEQGIERACDLIEEFLRA